MLTWILVIFLLIIGILLVFIGMMMEKKRQYDEMYREELRKYNKERHVYEKV